MNSLFIPSQSRCLCWYIPRHFTYLSFPSVFFFTVQVSLPLGCYYFITFQLFLSFLSLFNALSFISCIPWNVCIFLAGCLILHLPREIMWNANLMQQGNFIDVSLAWHVSGTYTHHQKHWMFCCSTWFSAPSFWMGGGLESCCVTHGTIRTVHASYAAALKTTTHPKTWCVKPHAATQHLMLLMMCVCTRNMSS